MGRRERTGVSEQVAADDRTRIDRAGAPQAAQPSAPMVVHRLPFRTPFDWSRTLDFLALRCIGGVEAVVGDAYVRTARWSVDGTDRHGWLRVCLLPGSDALQVGLAPALGGAAQPILAHLRAIFDLDLDMAQPLAALPAGTPMHGPMRIVGSFDGFELALRAIIGQQISVKAARTVIGRIVERLGEPLDDEPAGTGVQRVFPPPAALASLAESAIAAFGTSLRRAQTIRLLATAMAADEISLRPGVAAEAMVERLCALPGIGDWTAQYIALRALCWQDAFPAADLAVLRALEVRTPAAARAVARAWRPWRGYAVMNLWGHASPPRSPVRSD